MTECAVFFNWELDFLFGSSTWIWRGFDEMSTMVAVVCNVAEKLVISSESSCVVWEWGIVAEEEGCVCVCIGWDFWIMWSEG